MKLEVSRRKFIKSSLGTGILSLTGFPMIVPSNVIGGTSQTSPSDKIVMGAVGVGEMGTGHVRSFMGFDDVQMVGICDVRKEHRERAKSLVDEKYGNKDCKTYNDFRELLARKDIDAVFIATPDHWHALVGVEAARQHKDMYYEKPLSRYFNESIAIREAVERYGVVFQHGTQQRSDWRFRFATELVRNEKIGKLEKIIIGSAGYPPVGPQPIEPVPEGLDYDFWLGPAPWKPYTTLRCTRNFTLIYDYSLGCISGAYGIHDVDIAQWAVDADNTGPVEVEGWGDISNDGLYDTILRWGTKHTYANGVDLIYMDHITARQKEPLYTLNSMGIVFVGTEGHIMVQRGFIDAYPKSLLKTIIGPDEIQLPRSNDHRRNFLDSVKSRRDPICPVNIAARTDAVCHQADITIRLGRKLQWDPENEAFINDEEANKMLTGYMRSPWHI
jgi:predicted dehydrogenase